MALDVQFCLVRRNAVSQELCILVPFSLNFSVNLAFTGSQVRYYFCVLVTFLFLNPFFSSTSRNTVVRDTFPHRERIKQLKCNVATVYCRTRWYSLTQFPVLASSLRTLQRDVNYGPLCICMSFLHYTDGLRAANVYILMPFSKSVFYY